MFILPFFFSLIYFTNGRECHADLDDESIYDRIESRKTSKATWLVKVYKQWCPKCEELPWSDVEAYYCDNPRVYLGEIDGYFLNIIA